MAEKAQYLFQIKYKTTYNNKYCLNGEKKMKFDSVARRLRREVDGFDVVFYNMLNKKITNKLLWLPEKYYIKKIKEFLKLMIYWDKYKFKKNIVILDQQYDKEKERLFKRSHNTQENIYNIHKK